MPISLESRNIPEVQYEGRDYANEKPNDGQERINTSHHIKRYKDASRFLNQENRDQCERQTTKRPYSDPDSLLKNLH